MRTPARITRGGRRAWQKPAGRAQRYRGADPQPVVGSGGNEPLEYSAGLSGAGLAEYRVSHVVDRARRRGANAMQTAIVEKCLERERRR
jgi:hypothetical protein